MNALAACYSRTGTTRKASERISTALKCDIEEVIDTKNRSGVIGWLKSGRDAGRKTLAEIEPPKGDPASYDIVIIGTPIWNHTLTAPIRAYITEYKDRFKLPSSGQETALMTTHLMKWSPSAEESPSPI